MARNKMVRFSEAEKERLDEVREELYSTDEVAYATVVNRLCDLFEEGEFQ